MPALDLPALLAILLALLLGGLLKGATGAGTPVIAVPVIAAFFDVRLAVVLMVGPNLMTNLWQLRQFWPSRLDAGFTLRFALAGAAGAAVGTALLAAMPGRALSLLVAVAVIAYVALRLAQPDFRLAADRARRLVLLAGGVGGVLQGAAGISAPVSVSFLNAMRLGRAAFIPTISAYFAAMSVVQIPALFAAGLMTPGLLALSALALVPILLAMPAGAWAARRLSPRGFDRLTLVLLSILALRLLWSALG